MKAVIFSSWFEPSDEFINYIKCLGYATFSKYDYDMMFDPRIVSFCEKRASKLWGEYVYKGKASYEFRCGFAGAGYIRDIDITKKWIITHNHVDSIIIKYVDVHTNKYGHTYLSEINPMTDSNCDDSNNKNCIKQLKELYT